MRFMHTSALALSLFAGQAAFADGPYYGGGLAVYSSSSVSNPGSTAAEDVYAGVGLTAGYRWDQATNFVAIEADGDVTFGSDFERNSVACSDAAQAPYYCEHNATVRLRGLFGVPIGNFDGFASAGFAMMNGRLATSPLNRTDASNTGYTIGFGLEQDLSGNTIRYELIYDNLEEKSSGNGNPDVTFESISAKVSYLFN